MIHKALSVAALLLAINVGIALSAAEGPVPSLAEGQHEAHGAPAKGAAAAKAVTPMKAHTGALPAIPKVPYEPARPMAVVHQVYDFAARHPEVLQYIPCYCGCERVGHNGNHDCFVKSRAANGRVTEFDSHGIGCTICIDVAREAMTLHNAGSTPVQIRAAIDKKYGASFPSSTPTPRPPAAK